MSEEIKPWKQIKTSFRTQQQCGEDKLEYVDVEGGRLYRTWISHRTGCSVALSFAPTNNGALLQEIEKLKETVRTAHRAGYQHGMGPCVCEVCKGEG